MYRIRGLVKMSLLVACMFVAHNLHLRMVDEERRAKGRQRILRTLKRERVMAEERLRDRKKEPSGRLEDSRAP